MKGYEKQIGTAEGEANSLLYNERAFLLTCKSILHILCYPPPIFQEIVLSYYYEQGNLSLVIDRCKELIKGAEDKEAGASPAKLEKREVQESPLVAFPVTHISLGCLKLLKSTMDQLVTRLKANKE